MEGGGAQVLPNPPRLADSCTLLCGAGTRLGSPSTRHDWLQLALVCVSPLEHSYGLAGLLARRHKPLLVAGNPTTVLSDLAIGDLVFT